MCIDLDPQCNLSMIEGTDGEQPDIYSVLQGKAPAEKAIQRTETGYMIPGSRSLINHKPTTANAVRSILKPLCKRFDYAVIDCGPALDQLTINALTAADIVLVPCKADRFSLDALQAFFETYTAAHSINHDLKIGIFFVIYNPRATANRLLQEQIISFADGAGITVYAPYIRRCITIEEAQYMADLFSYAPRSNAAQDYNALFTEIIGKV